MSTTQEQLVIAMYNAASRVNALEGTNLRWGTLLTIDKVQRTATVRVDGGLLAGSIYDVDGNIVPDDGDIPEGDLGVIARVLMSANANPGDTVALLQSGGTFVVLGRA